MFSKDITNLEDKLIERRRHLHQNPELSFEEHDTQSYILKELASMGIVGEKIAGTGVIASLGPSNGPAIALRADIDGLPIQEMNKEKTYRSKRDGCMHACGHDGHTSSLLAVAEALKKREKEL